MGAGIEQQLFVQEGSEETQDLFSARIRWVTERIAFRGNSESSERKQQARKFVAQLFRRFVVETILEQSERFFLLDLKKN